jgi:hypothetical protein
MLRSSFGVGALFSAVVVAGACGGSTLGNSGTGAADDGGTAARTGLPCEVDKVLDASCRACHARPPKFGAPMPLVTWEDLDAPSPSDPRQKVRDRVLVRIADDTSPMPQPPNPRLGDADRKTLGDWVAAGAPRSDGDCSSPAPAGPGADLSCVPNQTLAPASAYELPADVGDQYVCWGVDLAKNPAQHVTAFRANIDNATIVHHVVLYESDAAFPAEPAPCDGGASVRWRMVYGWAPGVKPLQLPPDVGFPVATDPAAPTHYVAQIHYSNAQKLSGQKDKTSIELCTGAPQKYEADVMAFGSIDFSIPPGAPHTIDCALAVPPAFNGLHLFAAMPHMHKLGVAMTTTLTPKAGGAEVDLGTAPSFSFNTQAWFPIDATVKSGDTVRTKCTWVNNTGETVRFGEFTADEMCYSFTMYYPRIQSSVWSWAAPASGAPFGMKCSGK